MSTLATARAALAPIDETFITAAPEDTTVKDAELVDTSAWVQADLTMPDTYFTDVGASEPTGVDSAVSSASAITASKSS